MSDERQDEMFPNPIGERLKTAREAKGMSLDDVATHTRIPIRHLQHIEKGEWDALPALTYSVGFARSYANAVGIDGDVIGTQVREQLGGARNPTPAAVYYEPADPTRVPPRSLAIVAGLIALLLVVGYGIWRSIAVDGPEVAPSVAGIETELPPAQPAQPQPAAPVQATGPVVLTATDTVWLRISDGGQSLFQKEMKAGERYELPATAQAPQIRTGRPQALRVTVGNAEIPPLGAPEQTIDDVSLRPADLLARAQAAPPVAGPPLPTPPAPSPPRG